MVYLTWHLGAKCLFCLISPTEYKRQLWILLTMQIFFCNYFFIFLFPCRKKIQNRILKILSLYLTILTFFAVLRKAKIVSYELRFASLKVTIFVDKKTSFFPANVSLYLTIWCIVCNSDFFPKLQMYISHFRILLRIVETKSELWKKKSCYDLVEISFH